MIVHYRPLLTYAPVVEIGGVVVFDSAPTITPSTHRNVTYNQVNGGANHLDWEVSGLNTATCVVSAQSPANSINSSDFPRLYRNPGVDEVCQIKLSNGRAETEFIELNAQDIVSASYRSEPTGVVADSYAEFSWDTVQSIIDELDGPVMFSASAPYNRRQSAIPHSELTSHVFSSYGGSPFAGRRFVAITPRHVVGVAHYGGSNYQIGTVLTWRAADNTEVATTVIGAWSATDLIPEDYLFGTGAGLLALQTDIAVFTLSEALPASIKPLPIVGDWFLNIQPGATDDVFDYCPQAFGFTLFNNDAHFTPVQLAFSEDQSISRSTVTLGDFDLTPIGTIRWVIEKPITLTGFENLAFTDTDSLFYHNRRGGDSGSPVIVPIADGEWALCGMVSGGFWSESLLNLAIEAADENANVVTGLTVTVAPDPTL